MNLFILCIKIFLVRILDVSFGTFRTIITIKGKSLFASIIGFFEVLIWFLIVKEALDTNNKSIFIAISYSLGFATGTYIGSFLSNKFIENDLNIQIITTNYNLAKILRQNNFGVSVINIKGKDIYEKKYMLIVDIKNKNLNHLRNLCESIDKNSFIVVTETKYSHNGYIK